MLKVTKEQLVSLKYAINPWMILENLLTSFKIVREVHIKKLLSFRKITAQFFSG
jgi:hypothetical protein